MSYAIITGASGGIGLSMAKELAARKYDLLLVARSKDKLDAACQSIRSEYGVQCSSLAMDLSTPGSAAQIVEWVEQNKVEVKVLINNAGYGLWGPVDKVALSGLTNMMDLNMSTLVELSYGLIPYLKKSTPAYLLNVASTAAYQAVPTLSTYAATKAFVVLFTRGLRWELKSSGVSVSVLSPGPTSTGFIDRAGLESMKDRAEKFSMTADAVAAIAIQKMLKGKAEIVTGFMNWISVKATYWLPKYLIEKIAAGLYE